MHTLKMGYSESSLLLDDIKLMWGGNRIESPWTSYNTLGKILKQINAVWPGTSGVIAVAAPGGGLLSVMYEPVNLMESGDPPVVSHFPI